MKNKKERVSLILQMLAAAPTPSNRESAIALLNNTVDAVEDEHSGVPKEVDPGMKYKGRMYGIMKDMLSECAGGIVGRTRGQYVYFWNDGSFDILNLGGQVVTYNHHRDDR